jgi:arylsulfatase A-like enzyme
MYRDVDVPVPLKRGDEFETKPPQYLRYMEQCNRDPDDPIFTLPDAYGVHAIRIADKTEEQLKNMRKHYYAKITHIDEQVGKIMNALRRRGLLEHTLVIFTSDHGDNLGDHGMMYKWLMTEQSTKVPMIFRLPGGERTGETDEDLFTQIDIGPTLLEYAGMEVPCYLDGTSDLKRILERDISEIPEKVYCEDNYLTMVRSKTRRFIHYAGQPQFGEYYDIVNDPHEFENLFHRPEFAEEIAEEKLDLLEWKTTSRYLGSAVDVGLGPKPGRRWPAYCPEDPYILSGEPRPGRPRLATGGTYSVRDGDQRER